MSENLAGVTFLAFGNGSPDVFSTYAAMSTHSGSLAVGELIGAAGFITAVIPGYIAIKKPFKVDKKTFLRDVPFFIVAAGFSLWFLYDGRLTLWECGVMIAFYLFYAVVVMGTHWWFERRDRRIEKEVTARRHFDVLGGATESFEPYHDDPEDVRRSTPGISREPSADDFFNLERTGGSAQPEYNEEDESGRGKIIGELSQNMRLRRPRAHTRGRSGTTVRPSLIGALEFQSVTNSLQKSRNLQDVSINLRRYSDDPTLAINRHADQASIRSGPPASEAHRVARETSSSNPADHSGLLDGTDRLNRTRALTANAASSVDLDPDFRRGELIPQLNSVPEIDVIGGTPQISPQVIHPTSPDPNLSQKSLPAIERAKSPTLSLSPPPSEHTPSRDPSPIRQSRTQPSPNHLAPEDVGYSDRRLTQQTAANSGQVDPRLSQDSSAALSRTAVPKLSIPSNFSLSPNPSGSSTPTSPFPSFTDAPRSQSPLGMIPEPEYLTDSSQDIYFQHHPSASLSQEHPISWWPYSILPPPGVILSTFFPTLCLWREKTLWRQFLGLVAAPSIFLLVLTLPVVELDKDGDSENTAVEENILENSLDSALRSDTHDSRKTQQSGISVVAPGSPFSEEEEHFTHPDPSLHHRSLGGHGDTASIAVETQYRHNRSHHRHSTSTHSTDRQDRSSSLPQPTTSTIAAREQPLPLEPSPAVVPSSTRDWNRWLVIIQCFTAPFFVVLILWANGTFTTLPADDPEASPPAYDLLKPSLVGLVISLVLLALILIFTTPTHPPVWRPLLCFLGFAVSIAWISTVAGEVVGVLKALGVILDWSDAILGLTIFAVGNSLGDFVANATVATMGFPVMALSACFGGPMMNILLGIGISGFSIMARAADQRKHKHPHKDLRYKPYEIDVGGTLLVSGGVLLVTLVVLLVGVPLNKFRMDRKIGWCLIVLWVVATVVNVAMEATGLESKWRSSES
ncbi:MAG: hypothetical protein M1820_010387 [Bogoriella megaspora]|nr:MAG: hypothetical protein M1820_010387 [Bogoriella megaspora]